MEVSSGLILFYSSTHPQQILPKSDYNAAFLLSWIFIKALNTWIMKCRQEHINLAELFPFFFVCVFVCVFFNTYSKSINARWQLHFDTLNIYQVMWCAFEVFFFTLSIKWADSSLIHLFLLLTSCIFRNLTSALSQW